MWLKQLSDWVYTVEKGLVIILVATMFFSLSAGVIFRYYLNDPLLWSDELAIFALIWLTFLGGSMSIKRQQSAAVTLFTDRLQGRLKWLVISIGFAIITLFCLYLLYICYHWLASPNIAIQRSSSMRLPMIYVYLSVPVGFAFMMIHALALFKDSLKREQADDES